MSVYLFPFEFPKEEVAAMKQNFDVTKYDAQIINYIKKTVHNTAINYFVKNSRIEEAEVISGQKFLDFLIEDKTFFVKEMIRVETDNLSFEFDNLDLATEFEKLNREEKSFLMRKYILGYSDYEISIQLSLSRQGVTKKRQRILKKIRERLLR
ncbi:TPA: sigma-70 family RNA polymerase sigma factor [Enterococcus faecalis]|nr:sigma-70 family RNA polymerase sigma factor [Enterococcus faecalis]EET98786.1 predicted protein [Enterococcus faecalis T2]EFM72186.1 hypothetical protein HMPREF9515_02723 [Enterococcus faecalis TX0860]EFU86847.1 hypothetical protein HMPREF9507_01748 [Enterococcus faecalis TX0309B]EFU93228.1 hypothetical protein HMPREF9506_01979 [Enterococcus faecalis TX0309A]EJU97312.1 hypothetical protein HMPREF1331_02138 [Enterococcus faecalis ERV25]EJV17880.1 hypothetical protein HMPREF1337_01673 [Enter